MAPFLYRYPNTGRQVRLHRRIRPKIPTNISRPTCLACPQLHFVNLNMAKCFEPMMNRTSFGGGLGNGRLPETEQPTPRKAENPVRAGQPNFKTPSWTEKDRKDRSRSWS
jgi:hypothetical protein